LKVLEIGKRKYIIFRPFTVNASPFPPHDKGYYYKMFNIDVKLVRFVLEDNGFTKLPNRGAEWTFLWHGGSVK
jgi:hypothetical protein